MESNQRSRRQGRSKASCNLSKISESDEAPEMIRDCGIITNHEVSRDSLPSHLFKEMADLNLNNKDKSAILDSSQNMSTDDDVILLGEFVKKIELVTITSDEEESPDAALPKHENNLKKTEFNMDDRLESLNLSGSPSRGQGKRITRRRGRT